MEKQICYDTPFRVIHSVVNTTLWFMQLIAKRQKVVLELNSCEVRLVQVLNLANKQRLPFVLAV